MSEAEAEVALHAIMAEAEAFFGAPVKNDKFEIASARRPLLVLEPAYWSNSGSAWGLPSRSTHAKVECPSASSTASR